MKKILLIVGIASFSFAAAQNNGLPKVQVIPAKPKNNISTKPNVYLVTPPSEVISGADLQAMLANGNKIYTLPQDNMPCVVPDLSPYNMPVVKPEVTYTIPNPAYPPAVKPSVITDDQLKQLLEKPKKNK